MFASTVFRSLFPRLGISLTEVLIAMGILTVGLLGVAAIFPVGGFYMQQGEIADRGSAIAQAAFNDALARGALDPRNWLMFSDVNGPQQTQGTFSKPFAAGLRDQLALNATSTGTTLAKQQAINFRYGTAYVIDPLGVEGSPAFPANPTDRHRIRQSQTLPFSAQLASSYYTNVSWWPWNPYSPPPNASSLAPQFPLVRVTLPQAGPSANWPLTKAVASKLFVSGDDLSIDVPVQSDRPSTQLMEKFDLGFGNKADPLARQSRGDYSWIATVVPSTIEARNALASDPSAYDYEVSIAVFYKRVIDDLNVESTPLEQLTTAKVVSTGLNGGEVLIETSATNSKPFDGLKKNRWVVLCGPSPTSTSDRPQFVARWYRVLSIDSIANGIDQTKQRLVSLRGPQWPWQPATNLTTTDLSNNLCVGIIPNVVAVHSKIIQLKNDSAWSVQ